MGKKKSKVKEKPVRIEHELRDELRQLNSRNDFLEKQKQGTEKEMYDNRGRIREMRSLLYGEQE